MKPSSSGSPATHSLIYLSPWGHVCVFPGPLPELPRREQSHVLAPGERGRAPGHSALASLENSPSFSAQGRRLSARRMGALADGK